MTFLARLIVNGIAIWLASMWVTGITIDSNQDDTWGNILVIAIIALIFTVVNAFIKPLLKLLSLPLLILTLGLFTLVINALMLLLTAWISTSLDAGLTVDGFWTAVWGALIISIVNFVLSAFVPENR
ncbi:phage holin family protein [Rhodococcus sp. KBS0724]|uniref:phage holin family protein n=1 Tax=Rhodococcus sp. KBS0724 TaxID=1179674 RepID=UPI00110F6703|nr:phage holin family protein [Rhodococcus sp. KBS0724]TSD48548.1 phage holin family protein [Rhodococcus sp. KBS0724]